MNTFVTQRLLLLANMRNTLSNRSGTMGKFACRRGRVRPESVPWRRPSWKKSFYPSETWSAWWSRQVEKVIHASTGMGGIETRTLQCGMTKAHSLQEFYRLIKALRDRDPRQVEYTMLLVSVSRQVLTVQAKRELKLICQRFEYWIVGYDKVLVFSSNLQVEQDRDRRTFTLSVRNKPWVHMKLCSHEPYIQAFFQQQKTNPRFNGVVFDVSAKSPEKSILSIGFDGPGKRELKGFSADPVLSLFWMND